MATGVYHTSDPRLCERGSSAESTSDVCARFFLWCVGQALVVRSGGVTCAFQLMFTEEVCQRLL